jgi:hypothetical protein
MLIARRGHPARRAAGGGGDLDRPGGRQPRRSGRWTDRAVPRDWPRCRRRPRRSRSSPASPAGSIRTREGAFIAKLRVAAPRYVHTAVACASTAELRALREITTGDVRALWAGSGIGRVAVRVTDRPPDGASLVCNSVRRPTLHDSGWARAMPAPQQPTCRHPRRRRVGGRAWYRENAREVPDRAPASGAPLQPPFQPRP